MDGQQWIAQNPPDVSLLTKDLLNAAALLVASGNYTAEAAVEATFVLKELLAARYKKGKENNEAV
jgi:hypothetical protein